MSMLFEPNSCVGHRATAGQQLLHAHLECIVSDGEGQPGLEQLVAKAAISILRSVFSLDRCMAPSQFHSISSCISVPTLGARRSYWFSGLPRGPEVYAAPLPVSLTTPAPQRTGILLLLRA